MTTMESQRRPQRRRHRPTLFATLDAVKAAPAAAQFQFRPRNRWMSGTHSQSTIDGFFGVGEERTHEQATTSTSTTPKVLVGATTAPPRSSTSSTGSPGA